MFDHDTNKYLLPMPMAMLIQ
jgi:hypothetical protein